MNNRYRTLAIMLLAVEMIASLAACGARGTYRIDGIHWYEKQGENWIACNAPEQERGIQ